MPNLIEIFRGGTHTDMHGTTLAFGESEIAGIAAAYDPALSEAPIVIGHPRTDAPAYGWVKSLSARGDRLYAEPDQVDAAFAELVESGRYKKVSACFYRPAAPREPQTRRVLPAARRLSRGAAARRQGACPGGVRRKPRGRSASRGVRRP